MKDIDWEQRRYEIAKEVLAHGAFSERTISRSIYTSVHIADALIEILKKDKQMKATELKIGDWVSFADVPVKVKEVKQDGVCVDLSCFDNSKGEQGYAALEDLSPIPLTKEILEKNGWMKLPNSYILEIGDFAFNIRQNEDSKWKMYIIYGISFVFIKEFIYIHQLQHLLWALGIDDDLKI